LLLKLEIVLGMSGVLARLKMMDMAKLPCTPLRLRESRVVSRAMEFLRLMKPPG
jgi:hypothetical protein